MSQPWACAQQRGWSLLPGAPPGRNSPGVPGALCGLAGRAIITLLISQGSGMMRFMDQAEPCRAENNFSYECNPVEYPIYHIKITSAPRWWILGVGMPTLPLLRQGRIREGKK